MTDFSKLTDTVELTIDLEGVKRTEVIFVPPNLLHALRDCDEKAIFHFVSAILADTDFTDLEKRAFNLLANERIQQIRDEYRSESEKRVEEHMLSSKGMMINSARRFGKSHAVAQGLLEQIAKSEPRDYTVMVGSKGLKDFERVMKEMINSLK
jgi:hypothetical protein